MCQLEFLTSADKLCMMYLTGESMKGLPMYEHTAPGVETILDELIRLWKMLE